VASAPAHWVATPDSIAAWAGIELSTPVRARQQAFAWAWKYVLFAHANHENERLAVEVFKPRLLPHCTPAESEVLLAAVKAEARAASLLV